MKPACGEDGWWAPAKAEVVLKFNVAAFAGAIIIAGKTIAMNDAFIF
jgi:hypothetical protein